MNDFTVFVGSKMIVGWFQFLRGFVSINSTEPELASIMLGG